MNLIKHFIDGKLISGDSKRTGKVYNPATGEQSAKVIQATKNDIDTIAEMVSDDYVCAHLGKWHLGDDLSPQHGFEHWVSTDCGVGSDHKLENDYFKFLRQNGVQPPTPPDGYEAFAPKAGLSKDLTPAAFLAEETAAFINDHTKTNPDWEKPILA